MKVTPKNVWIVVVSNDYIRDAQMLEAVPPGDDVDPMFDGEWKDCSPDHFVDIVSANSYMEAIHKVAEETGYDKSILEAVRFNDVIEAEEVK